MIRAEKVLLGGDLWDEQPLGKTIKHFKISVAEEEVRERVSTVKTHWNVEPVFEGSLGNYELDNTPYAIGGFADVYRAKDKGSGESVAVKMPRITKEAEIVRTLDKEVFDEFLDEAAKWSRLKHPNIIELREFGSEPFPWLVMEFAEKGSLRKRLLAEGSLSSEEVIEIAAKLCNALHYTHNLGVVHLDIKPENILFVGDEPKLADFGTAKTLLYEKVTRRRFTPQYAAPEQLSHIYGEPDRRTDVYQLGMVIYEMLTSKVAFASNIPSLLLEEILGRLPEEPSKANPRLSQVLDDIVIKCLEKKRENRYEVIWLLKEDLERLK